jgi:hypothetical protein
METREQLINRIRGNKLRVTKPGSHVSHEDIDYEYIYDEIEKHVIQDVEASWHDTVARCERWRK